MKLQLCFSACSSQLHSRLTGSVADTQTSPVNDFMQVLHIPLLGEAAPGLPSRSCCISLHRFKLITSPLRQGKQHCRQHPRCSHTTRLKPKKSHCCATL